MKVREKHYALFTEHTAGEVVGNWHQNGILLQLKQPA